MIYKPQQSGYTLIELLLYVSIVGVLLISVSYFFAMIVDARVKNQSITEVNDQGMAAMDYITQVIHNATSITSPAAGGSGSTLTLVVPTGSLSPTTFDLSGSGSGTLGFNADGGTTDGGDAGSINATKFVAPASGTISTLYAFLGSPVGGSPNNLGQMAIYSGTSSPTTLLASSSSAALTASSWNAFSISSVNVTSGQTYWLAYNANGSNTSNNNLRYHTGTAGQSMFITQTFGSWPNSWSGSAQNFEFSMYAPITTSGTNPALEVTEGAASPIPLTNSKVKITSLSFKNLTRSGTPGIVQVTFTIGRVNANNRNEYDYTKTFTTSAEVGW
jgi:Tfp pilus assembly protein PilW